MSADITAAENRLRGVPGYTWLLDSPKQFWTAPEVAEPISVNMNTVKKWCSDGLIPGALNLGASGWRIPREGLILYFASRLGG